MPRESGDVDTEHWVDVQVGAEPEGLGDLGGLPPQRLQGAIQGPATVPLLASCIVQVAVVALGVDNKHPGRADDQVDAPIVIKWAVLAVSVPDV
jgi:hypothetical protein